MGSVVKTRGARPRPSKASKTKDSRELSSVVGQVLCFFLSLSTLAFASLLFALTTIKHTWPPSHCTQFPSHATPHFHSPFLDKYAFHPFPSTPTYQASTEAIKPSSISY